MNALAEVISPLLSLLYPPRCAVCRILGDDAPLCGVCAAAILPVPEPFCAWCGHPLHSNAKCRLCARREPAFACARALGAYDGVLRDAIHHFKYHDRPGLAEPLGILLAQQARQEFGGITFDAVLPVPMHAARQRLRGYNQAERLARVVARVLCLPLNASVLVRTAATRPQVGLNAQARQSNLSRAFAARHPMHGQTVLIVDDVSTTTTTLHECAAVLNAAGARTVYALSLAAG